jgi:hypothetical protein
MDPGSEQGRFFFQADRPVRHLPPDDIVSARTSSKILASGPVSLDEVFPRGHGAPSVVCL